MAAKLTAEQEDYLKRVGIDPTDYKEAEDGRRFWGLNFKKAVVEAWHEYSKQPDAAGLDAWAEALGVGLGKGVVRNWVNGGGFQRQIDRASNGAHAKNSKRTRTLFEIEAEQKAAESGNGSTHFAGIPLTRKPGRPRKEDDDGSPVSFEVGSSLEAIRVLNVMGASKRRIRITLL